MKKSTIVLVSIAAVLLIIIFWGIGSYNSFVTLREDVNSSLSTIDVQLKRRADLVPNLVNTVKGYASHETAAIDSVTTARAKMAGAATAGEKAQADAEMTSALSRLMVIVENYPNLKADANFRQLSDELSGTENRISVARQDFNGKAKVFNTRLKSFPSNIIGSVMGFEPTTYFKVNEADTAVPNVKF